jgi:glycosyltransferase involved in cell wall biosynthesis
VSTPAVASAPRRVLHVFGWFRPEFTGEGRYVEAIAPLLAERGIVNDIAVHATRPPARTETLPGIRAIHYFGDSFRGVGHTNPGLVRWIIAHVRDYDVIHLHAQIDRYFLIPLIARLAGRVVIQSCTLADGLGSVVASYRRAWSVIPRLLAGLINHAVTISPALYEDSLRVLPPARVHLIPQGVFLRPADQEAAAREGLRARWGLGPEHCVLLFVGGLCARKGVRTLVDAMPGLLRTNPDLRLMIVGPDLEPDYADALRAAAAAHSPGAVIFAGFQEQPAPFYRLADIFAFASHQEGFGNVLLEAMAFGLPVICRRLPGVTDWILQDGALGLLFDDDADYPALVRRLADDPAARAALAEAARASLAARFEMGAVADQYATLYGAAA